MLGSLEQTLLNVLSVNDLDDLLPAGDALLLVAGPSFPPPQGDVSRISIHAERWVSDPPDEESVLRNNKAEQLAFVTVSTDLSGAPTDQSYHLAGSGAQSVVEVQRPPGYPAVRGDDYLLVAESGGWTARFFQAEPFPVRFEVSDVETPGYREQRPCTIDLTVTAWTPLLSQADDLMGAVLTELLPELRSLGPIEAPWGSFPTALPPADGVRLRLLEPEATVVSVERILEMNLGYDKYRSRAQIRVTGTLQLHVADGIAPAGGTIDEIDINNLT